jgi:LuxR family maltose regulon positive regulatory protein
MPNRQLSFLNMEKEQNWRLGLLVAPAGSGKTRYLRHWAERRVKELGVEIAWLSLNSTHNEPLRFWTDLTAALLRAGILIHTSEEMYYLRGYPLSLEERFIELVNLLSTQSRHFTLILDGYEAINASLIHQALILLIDSLPPQMQVVIAGRTNPPLQQARLRVRRELVELGLSNMDDQASPDNPL